MNAHASEQPFLYAGEVTPKQAYEALQAEPDSVLVDVRTDAEWAFVGTPDLSSPQKKPILLSLLLYPDMGINPKFVSTLSGMIADKDTPLYFLCRSGGRSAKAAELLTKAGYSNCYNIAEGFEGEPDAHGHRNSTGGWRSHKLPWRQN